ncbi:hypothetical protein HA402_005746 [Bradysia odoriphaga]|nr:hypothetical protein HA402_005746 [Bradysia odoriphaga]
MYIIDFGVEHGEKYSDLYLNKWSKQLQVLPTFIFPFTNKIFLDMSLTNESGILLFDQTVHGEHYIEQIRHLPPKGDIHLEIKTLDVLDKGKGTLYILNMNGYDNNGEAYFKTEYQMFEIGTGGFNGNKSNPSLMRIAEPNENSEPDSVLEFSAIVPEGGYKAKLSDSDLTTISIYSPLHPRQHYSDQYDFLPCPLAHGRYTFGRVIKMILFKYGHGNAEKFKAAKVRFAEPVFLGENVQITTWQTDSRILFQGNVHRDGKSAKVLSGGYIDFKS